MAAVNAFAELDATVIERIRACGGLAAYVAEAVALAEGEREPGFWGRACARLQGELAAQREVVEGLRAAVERMASVNHIFAPPADRPHSTGEWKDCAAPSCDYARVVLDRLAGRPHPGSVAPASDVRAAESRVAEPRPDAEQPS